MPKTSIVLLTYNGLEKNTIPCIESLYEHTHKDEFELIVVDNDSQDGTKEYLKQVEEKYENLSIALSSVNKGFAGGMNDGIRQAKGDYIVLLNNDTLLTPNWLELLLYPFSQNQQIGISGPLTNNAENEQEIYYDDISPENYIEKTSDYINKNQTHTFKTNRLIFFCVAIKKDVIEKVGYLNEKFQRGFYEDNDYCIRAINSGYELAVSEGSFVYHRCGGSFTKFDDFELTELLNKNRDLLIKTHKKNSLYTDTAEAFLNKVKEDLAILQKEPAEADKALERVLLRLDRFSWQFDRMKEREKTLTKLAYGNIFSVLFRLIKSRIKFIRSLEHKLRQLKQKYN